jgi:hypothetical protein
VRAPRGAEPPRRDRAGWYLLALALLSAGLCLPNLDDYFLGDDFDLIRSFYEKPPRYLLALLWSNESGDAWKSWGIDPELGRGYLRPVKIWLLAADFALWGTNPLGFHLTSSAFFVGNVLLVFAILRRAIPQRPLLAFAGAWTAAVHPIFAEVVPFLTAREEFAATGFGLASFLAFLRFRMDGRSPAPFCVLYGLALLTKESAIAFLALPLAWDLVHGHLLPRSGEAARASLRAYAPVGGLLAGYFALRWIAFGNFVGGDGEPTHYLSPSAFVDFHARFVRSLFAPTLFAASGAPGVPWLAAALALLLLGLLAARRKRIPARRARDLAFFGPLWYLGSTAILYGTYFSVRHNLLPVIGLLVFATVLLDTLLLLGWLRHPRVCALGLLLASTGLLLPPTLATGREYRRASAAVAAMRALIEERTSGLPAGSTVSLLGVPQWVVPPFFFGWGLLSALKRPFTAADLAQRCTVINRRNLELNRSRAPIPERFDLEVKLEPEEWITPDLKRRHRLRLELEGQIPPQGQAGDPPYLTARPRPPPRTDRAG